MTKTPTTQTNAFNFSNTNSFLSTSPKANQSFNFSSTQTASPANYGIKSSYSLPNAQNAQANNISQIAQQNNPANKALSAKDLQSIEKTGLKMQKQELKNAQNPQLSPEQKSEKGRNIAGWTLAGIDSAVNIANAGMSYANMAKQWDMANKAWNASENQRQIENDRYNKREQERLNARDDARSAQKAVFGNREWHDANASQDGEGKSSQNNEGENGDKTAFTRD